MGNIYDEVKDNHLIMNPAEEEFLKPFLNGFDITWAKINRAYNTDLSLYIIKPARHMEDGYGFSREILLVYSQYPNMEPRTIQAAESVLSSYPVKGRVENFNFFLVSEDKNVRDWINKYISEHPESRIIVAFSAEELRANQGDGYYIRKIIDQYLYGRDLFDFRLPLESDYYFFGRKDIVASIIASISKNENKGLFGLRKTGKTSILYKIERYVKNNNMGYFLYYDCKSPAIRKLRWNQLLEKVCRDISNKFNIPLNKNFDEIGIVETFGDLIEQSKERGKVILVFDEIEYISPKAIEDTHWEKDFIDFWQTFWAVQSRHRNVSAIIVGVNPYPLEIDVIDGIQNPLFGIVSNTYLRGLEFEDMKLMIKTLGKKMGLRFNPKALEYLYDCYGGHPLLTRIACSFINQNITGDKPFEVTYEFLMKMKDDLDSHLLFYYGHVVYELKQFYKDEYDLLELLASGQKIKFIANSKHPRSTKHLVEYGLINFDDKGVPSFSMPVIGRYVGLEYMRRENRKTIYKLVEENKRNSWLQNRIKSIISDMKFLEQIIHKKNMPSLYGVNSFPEADELYQLSVVTDKASYGDFINTCNRCFVESIENYGKSHGHSKYFWNDVKNNYPSLWDAFYRIKLYRHAFVHRDLKEKPSDDFYDFLKKDLEGQKPENVPELNFYIQQCVLDSLLAGIQIEVNRYSS